LKCSEERNDAGRFRLLTVGLCLVNAAANVLKRKWLDALLMTGLAFLLLDHYLPGAGWLGILLAVGVLSAWLVAWVRRQVQS
jgi:hypothetical protein